MEQHPDLLISAVQIELTSTPLSRLGEQPRDRPDDEVSSNPVITIPYYSGPGEHLQRLGRQRGYRVYFKSSPSLRSLVRNDKIRLPFEDRPGVVYEIKCGCNASYIGETGNTLLDRFRDHMKALNSYRTAEEELNRTYRKRRGRPRTIPPIEAMEKAKNSSAVVEDSSQCSLDLHPRIICRESQFRLRQIKESLFIRNNHSINRDKGVEVSSIWTALINIKNGQVNRTISIMNFSQSYSDDGTRASGKLPRKGGRCPYEFRDALKNIGRGNENIRILDLSRLSHAENT
ncbi:hypothetical protein M513_04414 [Trichuris suis]|uniref:GIY-YIG domain-containing protein n=1 Tax=Trichuris suis TaxID=68888 RepID=A0A085MBW8_9BILA|nr:hypothetical protein M513_04414 [Trichuris suis]